MLWKDELQGTLEEFLGPIDCDSGSTDDDDSNSEGSDEKEKKMIITIQIHQQSFLTS